MIRLGLRLIVAGGREAMTRLALIAFAAAIGIALLLTAFAGINAVNSQNARYAWLETGYSGANAPAITARAAPGDALWWQLRADFYQGQIIGRVDLAATGPRSPVPPGIAHLPAPGQYYASPALAKLLRTVPAAELGDRFPGTLVGTIGPAALPAPNSLIIVIGRTVADLSHESNAVRVSRISTTVPSSCSGDCALGVGTDNNGIILILSIVAGALLFPVLIFIAGATRLSAARREQRFAAMRLVGATPRQISVIATVESSVAAVAGVAFGFGLFYALRPAIARIPFTGDPFFAHDLSLRLPVVVIVAVGVPIAAAVTARLALRRVNISPLGVTRHVTPRPPRARRVIPLFAGIAWLAYLAAFSNIAHTATSTVQAVTYLSGILVMMAGLVLAGPWLTMLGSRLAAGRATRPATLIAARRLADDPKAGFRAIRGVVLAVFVGTCSLAVITTIVAYNGGSAGATTATAGTVVDQLNLGAGPNDFVPFSASATPKLAAVAGVTGVALLHAAFDPGATDGVGPRQPLFNPQNGQPQDVVSCAQLNGIPALGRCPAGAQTASGTPDFGGGVTDTSSTSGTSWFPADLSPAQLQSLPIATVVVGTDASVATVEQARTILEAAAVQPYPPTTIGEIRSTNDRLINGYRQLADVVIVASLLIAGCSLAVSMAGGLAERKRPFSLLRLSGAPIGMLRRVVTIESAAPLLITAVVSAAAALLAAQLFLRAQLDETLQAPSGQYYVIVAGGLVASLAVITSTLPLLSRITGPETARNE